MMQRATAICLALMAAGPAAAQISVSFVDSAPTDIFEITNTSACPSGEMEVTIDLTGSEAGLLFDTTPTGVGVQVFQPFVLTRGAEYLTSVPQVADGARMITLSVKSLPGEGQIRFTIDVDDTLPQSGNGQIRVSGSEMAGAQVRLTGPAATLEADFGATGRAVLGLNTCLA